jgi:hypothetical protein
MTSFQSVLANSPSSVPTITNNKTGAIVQDERYPWVYDHGLYRNAMRSSGCSGDSKASAESSRNSRSWM